MSAYMYLSECGRYVCRRTEGLYEAWTVDGSIHWHNDDRIKTWDDAKRRHHPLPYAVGGYSATTIGQKPGSFTLTLLHCDSRKYIKAYAGNTIINSLDVVFRRKIPSNHVAKWMGKIGADSRDA